MVTMNRPDNGLPEDIREHMRLMCDIVALAFQTRYAPVKFASITEEKSLSFIRRSSRSLVIPAFETRT